MAAGLRRDSIFAIVQEVTEGTPVDPSAAAQFVALRPGFGMAYEVETIDNEELSGDVGAAKPNKGKESVSGEHSAYIKHSGTSGTAPQLDALYESIFGGNSNASAEYDTVGGSTTTVINLDTGEGANREIGMAILSQHGSGYEIRNISSISSDALTLNFALNNAPGSGILVGRPNMYKPGSSFTPFTAWLYNGNGFSKEMASGCQVNELSLEFNVNEYASATFSYSGTKYHFNPIRSTSSLKYIDWTDDDGTWAASVEEKVWRTPHELADALQAAMRAASTEDATVVYNDVTGKFKITSTGTVLSLLWNTGTNAANTIGTILGFSVAANDTGAGGTTGYTSDNAQTYAAAYTPDYDDTDPIVVKDAELLIGTQSQNVCVCARSATVTVALEVEDVDCICAETGTQEKVVTGRTVTMEAEVVVNKYDAQLIDQLLNNDTISAMLNVGPKSGGNWIKGKCVNVYLKNCVVSAYETTGDEFILANITLSAFVPADHATAGKDIYLNFV